MDASMAYACAATIGEFRTAHLEPILRKALRPWIVRWKLRPWIVGWKSRPWRVSLKSGAWMVRGARLVGPERGLTLSVL